jgi:hypothetical protein
MSRCILWNGATSGNGYGVTSKDGKQMYVHRLAAEQSFGPIPEGMVVAHKCDTPNCHNPEHLFICTQAENLADMRGKGRSASGEKHRSRTHPELVLRGESIGNSKLKPEQITAIRAEYKPGNAGKKSETSLTGIAKKYGIAFQTVSKIVRGTSWKHL